MGLDWICLPKQKEPGVDTTLMESRIAGLNNLLDEKFSSFCKSKGEDVPFIWPNELSNEFNKLEDTIIIKEEMRLLQKSLNDHMVSPAETLKAPRIGIDESADAWIKDNWENLCKKDPSSVDGKEFTIEEFIENNHGQYLVEAMTPVNGIPSVTGVMAPPTSFRGKVLRFVDWLDEVYVDQSYEDMSPEELYTYGGNLRDAAKAKRDDVAKSGIKDSVLMGEIELVEDAANWCVFWGENGHAMHAWY